MKRKIAKVYGLTVDFLKKAVARLKTKRQRGFELTKNFAMYLVLLVVSFFMTQVLRSHLSNIFFVFMLIFPFVMLVYVLISKATLTVYKDAETSTVEKNQAYTYEFKMMNSGILPYPFIDAYMELPQPNSVRTNERVVRLSMPPLKDYCIKNTVNFHFRGTYTIGVKSFCVYDLFRMFRVRIDFDNYDTVYVMPRQLYIRDSGVRAPSDEADRTKKVNFTYDRVEISDIRDYRIGDSLKSIHWKLSSKSEDFIVRDYDSGTTRRTYIFADMAARFPDEAPKAILDAEKNETSALKGKKKEKTAPKTAEKYVKSRDFSELRHAVFYEDMNEYCADGVCELTVATLLRELRAGNTVSLFWFDSRASSGACGYTIRGMEDFAIVFKMFATCPLTHTDKNLFELFSMVKDVQNIKLVFVSAAIDPSALAAYTRIAEALDGSSSGSAELLLYNPDERFLDPIQRKVYIGNCTEELFSGGITLTEGVLLENPDE